MYIRHWRLKCMMTSSNRTVVRVADPLWGESIGHRWFPLTKASDAELLSAREQMVDQTIVTPSRSLWRHCNSWYLSWADSVLRCRLTGIGIPIIIDNMVSRPLHLFYGNPYTCQTSLCWINTARPPPLLWNYNTFTHNIKAWHAITIILYNENVS